MLTEMKLLATFRGAKRLNEFRDEVLMYSTPIVPTGRFAFDLINNTMLFVPTNHVYNYIFNNLFDARELWVHSRELENVLSRIPHYKRNWQRITNKHKVCILKSQYFPEDVSSTLAKRFYKFIDWTKPHDCYDISNHVTDHKEALIVSLPEVNSTIMVNPKYFDVKLC